MTSVRKSIKAAKRKLKELERQGKEIPQDGSIMVMARAYANNWKIAAVPSVSSIRAQARLKAFKQRNERKIKKLGKWADYCAYVAFRRCVADGIIKF